MAGASPTRSILGRAVRPILALVGVTVVGIAGFVTLAGVGVVDAGFWLFPEHAPRPPG